MSDKFNFTRFDLRRLWLVIGSISHIEKATIQTISTDLGFPLSTVQTLIKTLEEGKVFGLVLVKKGSEFSILESGIVDIKKTHQHYIEYIKR